MRCSILIVIVSAMTLCTVRAGDRYPDLEVDLPTLLEMPMQDMINARSRARDAVYLAALHLRPEIQNIDWNSSDNLEIAKQLWKFRLDKPDSHYHRELSTTWQIYMLDICMHSDQIKDILAIISEWGRSRCKAHHFQTQCPETRKEAHKATRERRLARGRERREERRIGLGLPLKDYLGIRHPETMSSAKLHQEALKYGHKYKSCNAFVKSLRFYWSQLGRNDAEIMRLNRDPGNYNYEGWVRTPTSTDRRRRYLVQPQESIESASTSLVVGTDVEKSNDWGDPVYDGLDLPDLDECSNAFGNYTADLDQLDLADLYPFGNASGSTIQYHELL